MMISSHAFSCTAESETNELTKSLLPEGAYEVKFVSRSASVSVIFPRIKFPCHNSFVIIDFWIDSFRLIC